MSFNQVLVIYKQIASPVTHGQRLHLKTLDILYPMLKKRGISFDARPTSQLGKIGRVDLVITIGGDGTVLAASHYIGSQPIVGIKSYGKESVGYFCSATTETMEKYLDKLLSGKLKPIKLNRLKVTIDGHQVEELALNDVLFAHALPAATSKYKLTVGGRSEAQKSSGIWVSSAAGSTAAVFGAGGKTLPLTSGKVEYIVREPYSHAGTFKLLKGIVDGKTPVKLTSLIKDGTISIDGSHIQYPAGIGTKIDIRSAKEPLNIYWK